MKLSNREVAENKKFDCVPVDHLPETTQKWVNNRSDSQITMVMALHYFENEAAHFVCYAADALIVVKLLDFAENLFVVMQL